MKKIIPLLVVFALVSCHWQKEEQFKKHQLLNEGWTFSQEGKEEWYPAKVPGVVHLDLLNNDKIGDPYWENNELKQRWIEKENWIYQTSFTVDEETLNREHIEIDFKGLDTYAHVYLNDQKIIQASNMFRSWKQEIKPFLIKGENHLKIIFYAPVGFKKKLVENYPHRLPSGNETEDIEVKVASFSRKAAYQFGWDWGPRFVSSGIWRGVQLIKWDQARVIDVHTVTEKLMDQRAKMNTEVEVKVSTPGEYELVIEGNRVRQHFEKGMHKVSYEFEIENPKLWWTNELGEAYLYEDKVELYNEEGLLDTASNRYGVRTIELINKKDSIGTAFYFMLNGKPVFMKGANYIPQDVFLPRVRPQQYVDLISAVKEAHMNMLRVWGGGIYEEDIFYDLCDENGILVWQDFMFAGSLYPNSPMFKENVRMEVIENIKRLRSHPCLALWCGNNEIEVAWKNWGWQKQYDYSALDSLEIWQNYKSIFHELLPHLVAQYDRKRSYTPTSPLSNWGTAENFNHSSMHYWGVWHGREPFEEFSNNVGRFMVEYGFQSFPDIQTLEKVVADSSLSLASVAMKHRQKSYIGNGLISKHIEQYYEAPTSFENFIELSQKTQAKGMRMAIRAHMNKRPHCMGSLFWQLNDCWPGPSWSVIDYYGNKKVAYDAVKEEFATQ